MKMLIRLLAALWEVPNDEVERGDAVSVALGIRLHMLHPGWAERHMYDLLSEMPGDMEVEEGDAQLTQFVELQERTHGAGQ